VTAGGAPVAVHTLNEAAAILRVKPSWLERQAAARRIPFTMLGGSYRFTAEHLAAIVRQYEQRPVITSADEPSRAAARQATATQLPNDIKVKPLRPRPRRAA
jgi:excisionase family DNA binding protein